MIDQSRTSGTYRSVAEVHREHAERLEQQLARAEERAKYWEAAYFDHMRDEHPEIVERAMRRIAEGEA